MEDPELVHCEVDDSKENTQCVLALQEREEPELVHCEVDDSTEDTQLQLQEQEEPELDYYEVVELKEDTQLPLEEQEEPELIYCEVVESKENTLQPVLQEPVPPSLLINFLQTRRIRTTPSRTVVPGSCDRNQKKSFLKTKVILTIAIAIFAILSIVFMVLYSTIEADSKPCVSQVSDVVNVKNTSCNDTEKKWKACQDFEKTTMPPITTTMPKCSSSDAEGKSCDDLYRRGNRIDGIYIIDPDGLGAFNVRCDMSTNGGGWTIFQRRFDGSVDFYLEWKDYKEGFGNLNAEFWLGLDKIHRLSQSGGELIIDLEDFKNEKRYAIYSTFAVANETEKYKLTVGGYSGNAGDSLIYHNGKNFTTKDADNDQAGTNCARKYKGAWWYKICYFSNLNGLYLRGLERSAGGVNWNRWKGPRYSLKKTEMKIRPHSF